MDLASGERVEAKTQCRSLNLSAWRSQVNQMAPAQSPCTSSYQVTRDGFWWFPQFLFGRAWLKSSEVSRFYLHWIEKDAERQKQGQQLDVMSCWCLPIFPLLLPFNFCFSRQAFASLLASLFHFYPALLCIQGANACKPHALAEGRGSAQGRHWPETRGQKEEGPPSPSLLCVGAALGVAGQLFVAPSCRALLWLWCPLCTFPLQQLKR